MSLSLFAEGVHRCAVVRVLQRKFRPLSNIIVAMEMQVVESTSMVIGTEVAYVCNLGGVLPHAWYTLNEMVVSAGSFVFAELAERALFRQKFGPLVPDVDEAIILPESPNVIVTSFRKESRAGSGRQFIGCRFAPYSSSLYELEELRAYKAKREAEDAAKPATLKCRLTARVSEGFAKECEAIGLVLDADNVVELPTDTASFLKRVESLGRFDPYFGESNLREHAGNPALDGGLWTLHFENEYD